MDCERLDNNYTNLFVHKERFLVMHSIWFNGIVVHVGVVAEKTSFTFHSIWIVVWPTERVFFFTSLLHLVFDSKTGLFVCVIFLFCESHARNLSKSFSASFPFSYFLLSCLGLSCEWMIWLCFEWKILSLFFVIDKINITKCLCEVCEGRIASWREVLVVVVSFMFSFFLARSLHIYLPRHLAFSLSFTPTFVHYLDWQGSFTNIYLHLQTKPWKDSICCALLFHRHRARTPYLRW